MSWTHLPPLEAMASNTGSGVVWSNGEYEIRPAKNTDEFRDVWWGFMQILQWNRGYYDLDTYMNPSLGSGMILLIEKATAKCVGHVSAVINPNSTGWVSMFIIDEKHRGKGLGRELFKAAEADFERNGTKTIGLDGVVEQRQTCTCISTNTARLADVVTDERRRFVASPLGEVKIMMRPLVAKKSAPAPSTDNKIVDIRSVPQTLLVQHETKYTGFERPALWSDEHLFRRKDVGGVAIVRNGSPQTVDDLLAWTITRRCSGGIRIGPVYARDSAAAKTVIAAAMEKSTPKAVQDVPLPGVAMHEWSAEKISDEATLVTEVWGGNPEAVQVFEELGWEEVPVSYYRMWVNARATPEQSEGGAGQEGVYAIFDAAVG